MHPEYLGDSFDIVKRFWADHLCAVAPLFAHPKFVPPEIREQYCRMIGAALLPGERPPGPFGLFLDPDTGIPLPTSSSTSVTAAHAPLSFVVGEFRRLRPTYAICFDQSHDRGSGLSGQEQRDCKRRALHRELIPSFYYVSHAPFLFMAEDDRVLNCLLDCLTESGVPASRFESRPFNEAADKQTAAQGGFKSALVAPLPKGSICCPACGTKVFKRWPWGWDAHAAHSCGGMPAGDPEARKAEYKRRFAHLFEFEKA